MIVKWKSDGPERFVTEWRGMRLTLERAGVATPWTLTVASENPSDVLAVNGAAELAMPNRWATARHAMSDIDTVMENVVLQLAAAGPRARQRGTALFASRAEFRRTEVQHA